ncbi:MAG: hypothetical protein ACNA7V_03370 [Bacteroidales bacterium]
MNYYKPYSYLYKIVNGDLKLLSCFVVSMPAGKSLRGPDITSEAELTTIEYEVFDDEGQDRDRQEEYENELEWNGEPHAVKIVIGSGSGIDGGAIEITSQGTE